MERAELEAEVRRRAWFHDFEIAPGLWTGGHYRTDPEWVFPVMQLPPDLKGKRVLDLGCADGLFSFAMARHGADVTALDLFSPDFRNVEFVSRLWKVPVRYVQSTVYEFRDEPFDLILAMGVLYHLQHPVLGLQCLNRLARDIVVLESHISRSRGPWCRFLPGSELNRDPSNWWVPTRDCLRAMVQACGFEILLEHRPNRDRHMLKLRKVREVPPALGVDEVFIANYGHPAP